MEQWLTFGTLIITAGGMVGGFLKWSHSHAAEMRWLRESVAKLLDGNDRARNDITSIRQDHAVLMEQVGELRRDRDEEATNMGIVWNTIEGLRRWVQKIGVHVKVQAPEGALPTQIELPKRGGA